MQAIDRACLDTIAACGDVNRNVMCMPNPHVSQAHAEALKLARTISEHLLPHTRAYREIWLEGEKIVGGEPEDEPIYGKTYLPRKFKTVIAVPPDNDVDVFAHDLGFSAAVGEGSGLEGWNVTIGGGMGMTHGEPATFPRTAEPMAFCRPEQAVDVAEKVVLVQRDFGDRTDRKHARLKYTVEDRGVNGSGPRSSGDWATRSRILDRCASPTPAIATAGPRTGRERPFHAVRREWPCPRHAAAGDTDRTTQDRRNPYGEFRLTANQNLIIAQVQKPDRERIEGLLREHGLGNNRSGLRLNAMACVALPTSAWPWPKASAYLPGLVDALEEVLDQTGLRQDDIVIRMTGCPNGCARPFLAEIGLVGRGPGIYNLYLGAAFDGSRLNKLYRQDIGHDGIISALRPLLQAYAAQRQEGERFGDFLVRTGVVRATRNGADFHAS